MKKIFVFLILSISILTYLLISGRILNYLIAKSIKKHHRENLVKSYIDQNQYALYDQALAVIYYSHNDIVKARRIINQLIELKKEDKIWSFSYKLDSDKYISKNANHYTGAQIWITKALIYYQNQTRDHSYEDQYVIEKRIVFDKMFNKEKGLIIFSHKDHNNTGWNENEVASMEHNLDLWIFPRLGIIPPIENNQNYNKISSLLKKEIIAGINVANEKLDKTQYLDVYLLSKITEFTHTEIPQSFEIECEDIYLPKCYKFQEKMDNIWYEGSFMAMIANQSDRSDLKTQALLSWHLLLNKGIPYSSKPREDFPISNSVAPLMWLWMWNNNILENYK